MLEKGKSVDYDFNMSGKRGVYLFLIDGELSFENENLAKRDAMSIWDTQKFKLTAGKDAHFLIIEVPMV
jgi:redox-sensitive bicupin YhaK (pirin superfamily)